MTPFALQLTDALGADPFASSLGFRIVDATEGEIEAVVVPQAAHANAGGIVHGGFLSAFADWSSGMAVFSTLPAGHYAPHANLTIQYLKVAQPLIPLHARARCLTAGRQAASGEVELRQGDTVVAKALSSHVVVERRDR